MTDNRLLELTKILHQAAEAFHNAGAQYYTNQRSDQYSRETRLAARAFLAAAVPYLKALNESERYLLSIARDKASEAELQQIRTRKNALAVLLENLNRHYPPE